MQTSATEYCAWTGGKPLADWSGLDPSAQTEPHDDYQYRPSSPGSSQKSTKSREIGLDSKFTRDAHLMDFVDSVEKYLYRTGMDTISFLPDPNNPSEVASVVTCYSKFDLQDAVTTSRTLRTSSFDRFDRNNDDSARNWLLDSIDPGLKKDVTDRLQNDDGFTSHWLQLIHLVQSTSFNRFTVIKRDIESSLTLMKFPGQNVKDLATVFLTKARELDNHGFYEHRLTLCMLDRFLEGGGTNNDVSTMQYRHTLFQLRQKLDQALIKIGRLELAAQTTYMATENLTYRDICSKAEEEWRKLFDDNKWAPAKTKVDNRRAPAQFGANVAAETLDPAVLALVQQLQSSMASGAKPGTCHNCGKPGHWSRECPDKKKENGGNNRGRNNGRNRGSGNDRNAQATWK